MKDRGAQKRKFGSAQIKDTRAWPYIFVGRSISGEDRRKFCKFGVEGDTGRTGTDRSSRRPQMLSLASRVCRPPLLSTNLPIVQSPYIFQQIRTKKRIKLPPELYPDHNKRLALGVKLPVDPATNHLYLKDIEELRYHNSVTGLATHKKGILSQKSIHGRAELVVELMRNMDRQRAQTVYKETGKLLVIPPLNFYLARAYYILRGQGDWTKFRVSREPKEIYTESKKKKYSIWTDWPESPRSSALKSREKGSYGEGNFSTSPWVVNYNIRQFMRRFCITEGSELEELWARQKQNGEFEGNESGYFVDRKEIPTDGSLWRTKKPSSLTEGQKDWGAKDLAPAASEESPREAETMPKKQETIAEQPQIWQPNQKDVAARQSTFSHPSQTTMAQATKQLRSDWSPKAFRDLNLICGLPEAIEKSALKHLQKEIECTDIQKLAIPIITKLDTTNFEPSEPPQLRSFLIAAETGSGKTLAYLVPLINRLKREEEWALQNPDNPNGIFNSHRAASPRAIIVVPTSELAEQIYFILKQLSHTIKLTVTALLPRFSDQVVRSSILSKYIDVLISTPHRLNEFIQSNELRRKMARYLIVDEADTLFDRSFQDSFPPLLTSLLPNLTHLVLCSATIPSALESQLSSQFPGMQRIVTPKIHTAPRRLDFQVAFESDKRAGLLNALRTIQLNATEPDADVKRTIVFCNARETVREVYEYLKAEEDIATKAGDPLHFELIPFTRDNYDRHTALERFNEKAGTTSNESPDPQFVSEWYKHGDSNSKALRVLITTDMASRGLDTLDCKTLVLYDIPFSNIDLLHRLGRTARAGKRGKAIMLVSKAEYRGRTREWVNEIRDRVIKGEALV